MGDTYLRVLSYNTHLFGSTLDSFLGAVWQGIKLKYLIYEDQDRKHQIIHYLEQNTGEKGAPSAPPIIDLVVLQEVWSGQFAEDFRDDLRPDFTSFLARKPKPHDLNESGVCLQALYGISFADTEFVNYHSVCDHGFDSQDVFSGKGFLSATASLDNNFDGAIPAGKTIPFGLIGSHMITNQGTYVETTTCCYNQLNGQLVDFAKQNLPALLLADLNTPERSDPGSEYATNINDNLCNFGSLPVTISEAYIDSRAVSYPGAIPVMCYSADNGDGTRRYLFSTEPQPVGSGWRLESVPYYVPGDSTAQTPVYLFQRTLPSGAGNDYRCSTDSTVPAGWNPNGIAFTAAESTTTLATPIYEWTLTDGALTFYAYFPATESLPTGWTMGGIAFYGIDLLASDPAYTVDSVTNTFWGKVNERVFFPSNDGVTQERIDYIFHTAPAAATTTFEVMYASVLIQSALRVDGTLDCSDHFPIFAVIKVSDPNINSGGAIPVLCYSNYTPNTTGLRFYFTTGVVGIYSGWHLECAPFFVPSDSTGQTPVYLYERTVPLYQGNDYRLSTASSISDPTWTQSGVAFSSVQSSNSQALPIYEWTCQTSDGSMTFYTYFPLGTLMIPGWTMGAIAFYALKRGSVA